MRSMDHVLECHSEKRKTTPLGHPPVVNALPLVSSDSQTRHIDANAPNRACVRDVMTSRILPILPDLNIMSMIHIFGLLARLA